MTGVPPESQRALCARIRAGELSRQERASIKSDARVAVQRAWAARLRIVAQRRREALRLRALLQFETALWRRGVRFVAGVDEAGAGPLAGPVFAAAVVLPEGCSIAAVDDSKKLLPEVRAALAATIKVTAHSFCIAQASVQEIDALNIRNACLLAMRRAVCGLPQAASLAPPADELLHVLVDAHTLADLPFPQQSIIKGDARSQSIAAASILAKQARDALMRAYAVQYPGYGFEVHKGYGTSRHLNSLQALGPSPIHRQSFSPVASALEAGPRPV